ncbi:MAG: N-acetylneuraminate synthase family protein [Pseudomonadota bacterium]
MIFDALAAPERVFVIAEVGNNHEGILNHAVEMVRLAAEAGADAVKFQTAQADLFISPADPERLERFKRFDLGRDGFLTLRNVAHEAGIAFISTPLDMKSAAFLGPVVDALKIASGDNTFVPLLRYAGACGKPIILSTGMADIDTVNTAVDLIEEAGGSAPGTHPLAILHCVSSYPTPPADANLRAIATLAESFDYPIGYSDHTLGIEAPVLAAAVGARVIEKHFTLDKAFSEFRDHALSADPDDLAFMVSRIRATELLLGNGRKEPQKCEIDAATSMRRSIAAARDLPAGHRLTMDDLMWIRPGTGMPPGQEDRLIGKRLIQPVSTASLLDLDMFEAAAA